MQKKRETVIFLTPKGNLQIMKNVFEITHRDRAQAGYSMFLRRLSKVKAGDIAKEMEISDSALSELKNKFAENVLLLLAHLNLKVVDASSRCMDPIAYEFLTRTHERMARTNATLLWEEEE